MAVTLSSTRGLEPGKPRGEMCIMNTLYDLLLIVLAPNCRPAVIASQVSSDGGQEERLESSQAAVA